MLLFGMWKRKQMLVSSFCSLEAVGCARHGRCLCKSLHMVHACFVFHLRWDRLPKQLRWGAKSRGFGSRFRPCRFFVSISAALRLCGLCGKTHSGHFDIGKRGELMCFLYSSCQITQDP